MSKQYNMDEIKEAINQEFNDHHPYYISKEKLTSGCANYFAYNPTEAEYPE